METIVIDNEYTKMWMADGIIYNVSKPNFVMNLTIAKLLVQDRLKVANGKAYPLFIDMSNLVAADMEARKYLSGEEAIYLVTAGALLMTSPIGKFAGNLFLRINQPRIPTRIFTNKKAAIEWLQKYKLSFAKASDSKRKQIYNF